MPLVSLKTTNKRHHQLATMGEPAIDSSVSPYHQIQYTSSGQPYIALETGSDVPIFLTPYYATDVEAYRELVDHPSMHTKLASPPIPYLREHAQLWYVDACFSSF